MIQSSYDSGVYSGGPIPMEYVVKRAAKIMPLEEQLIKELRKIRDNGDAKLLESFDNDTKDSKNWNGASSEDKERAKKCWIELSKITYALNKSIMFIRNDSPILWKKLTKEWFDESGIMI